MNLQALVLCCIAAGNTLAQAQVVEIKNTVPSTPPIATEAPAVSDDFTVLEQEMLDLINEARETAARAGERCPARDGTGPRTGNHGFVFA